MVQDGGDFGQTLAGAELRVALDIAGHAVDNVGHGLAGVGLVSVVVDDGGGVDLAVSEREKALVPVDVTGEVSVDAILEHKSLEGGADMLLVGRVGGAVHGSVAHDDDPGSLGAVDTLEVLLQPLVLLVGLGVGHVGNAAEGTAVSDVGLRLRGVSLVAGEILGERPLGAVGVVGFSVHRDKVGETVVEGVPEVADTAGLLTGHAETVLVGSEVSTTVLAGGHIIEIRSLTNLWEGGQL